MTDRDVLDRYDQWRRGQGNELANELVGDLAAALRATRDELDLASTVYDENKGAIERLRDALNKVRAERDEALRESHMREVARVEQSRLRYEAELDRNALRVQIEKAEEACCVIRDCLESYAGLDEDRLVEAALAKAREFLAALTPAPQTEAGEPKEETVPRGHCGRCVWCGWSYAKAGVEGVCLPNDCCMRPLPPLRTHCAGCGAPYEESHLPGDTRK